MLVVYNDGFADKIGLRPGDTIKSVAGRDFTNVWDIEELKLLIKENLGKKVKAVVERDGKTQTIDLKLPKTIPAEAIVN
ncbi:MAG: PDZ domain-containing protein [Acidobacteria bacterium]|nr:PDZ domain-containing protein [Acidobacteriota bacterium]